MKFIRIALLCLVPTLSQADDFATLADARKVTDRAVALFAEEKFTDGYGVLKPYWPLPAAEVDTLANQTNMQWLAVRQRFGAPVGTEFMSEAQAGSSLARFTYLLKFQNHAVRWVFTLYKPKDRWIVNGVFTDDQLNQLFP